MLSAPAPPLSVSLPAPPSSVSLPPRPERELFPALPVRMFASSLPVPLMFPGPVSVRFSKLAVSVRVSEVSTVSVPAPRPSVTTSFALSAT